MSARLRSCELRAWPQGRDGGIGLAYPTDEQLLREPMGRLMLGVIIGVVLVIFLLFSACNAIF